MEADKNRRHAVLSWLFVGAVVALSVALGVLQYRWIGDVSLAERDRLRAGLQGTLHRIGQDFNAELTTACAGLVPVGGPPAGAEADEALVQQFAQWKESSRYHRLFRRVGVLTMRGETVTLRLIDPNRLALEPAEWPDSWSALRDRIQTRFPEEREGGPRRFGGLTEDSPALVEMPRFFMRPERGGGPFPFRGRPEPPREPFEMIWLILELDLDYVRAAVIPELLQRHFGAGLKEYDIRIAPRQNPSAPIYSAQAASIGGPPDASVEMFEVQFDQIMRRAGIFRDGRRGPGRPRGASTEPPPPGRGRWLLSARHHAGSLDALVNRTRFRNLAVTAAVLLLMLAAVAALVRFTQRAQRLAQLQMEFVAGVSHELRTPLSVIRTAAHNLGGGVVSSPQQVQRYGGLIASEAERLTGIVEQVLRFASAKAGRPIGAREHVWVEPLIDNALAASARALEASGCKVEKCVEPGLPPVLADPVSLTHAVQNLLTNAAKYGPEGGWIGISASQPVKGGGIVEICVADRGPGIPKDELDQIFEPFYRGRRALEDQIHGTGLGLNLVKRTVEAHEGTVAVNSEPGILTEFRLRIPAAPPEEVDEFADPSRRG